MKAIIGLLLLASAAPAQNNSIGVCATPTPFLGGFFLGVSLVGNVSRLPIGTIIRLMRGQTVISEEIITARGLLPITPGPIEPPPSAPEVSSSKLVVSGADTSLLLRGVAQDGDTVSITPPNEASYSIVISPLITGTEQAGYTLTIFWSSAAPALPTVFIEGQSLRVSNAGVSASGQPAINVNTAIYHGWQPVTVCQSGACDTALIRLP